MPSLKLEAFPVVVPANFVAGPVIKNSSGKVCSSYQQSPYKVQMGGGFDAPRAGAKHYAVDLMGCVGFHLVASVAGKVPTTVRVISKGKAHSIPGTGISERGGNYIYILDQNGFLHYYAHADKPIEFKIGDAITAGQFLGYLGVTGAATGGCPHLHYQTKSSMGAYMDPEPELKRLWPQ